MKYLSAISAVILLVSCTSSPRFSLLPAEKTGVDFNNLIEENGSLNLITYENIYNGAGLGIGDLNNDGLQDLVFAGNQVTSKVYLNLGNFRFKDISANLKGLNNDQWYSGVTIGDVNNDGFQDIYLTSTGHNGPLKRMNRLWINDGASAGNDPSFTEMAEQYGVADTSQSVNAAFFDYDCDGDADLYVLNNTVNTRMNTSYRPKITDGSAENNDRLYRNNGDNTFTDVSREAGIVIEGFGLGLAISDINKDGYPDIYVSNDYITNDILYINNRNGTFSNMIGKYLSYQSTSSMGNDVADVNNDGNPDIFTLDMLPVSYARKKQTINGFSYIYRMLDDKYGFEHQYLRNMLHIHNGFLNGEMIPFSETGQMTGLQETEWSWAPLFADYDNDGDRDLIVSNGYPRDMTDKDWMGLQAKSTVSGSMNEQYINLIPSVKVPNFAFENQGELNFSKRNDWLPQLPSYSYGAAYADFDNDGDLDLAVSNVNDKAFILKNNTVEKSADRSHFLRIRLRSKSKNHSALGAKVEIWCNGSYQYAENFLTRGYASCVDPVIHFGLGNNKSVDSIKITWPAASRISLLKNIKAGSTLEIDEAESVPAVKSAAVKNEQLLFRERDSLINYIHKQTDFADFLLNQKILPHKFSQTGPCIASGDLDGDGHDDLLTGSTNLIPASVWLRRGEGFTETSMEGLSVQRNYTESDLAILDIDGDGDNDVIALRGGYESKSESENQQSQIMISSFGNENSEANRYNHLLLENQGGKFVEKPLPVPPFLASVVRPYDFNKDGSPELFIGARVKKGKFPYSDRSWMVMNNHGQLSASPASAYDLGMVTDAVWADYDNDGWTDLIVTTEWSSIELLKNMNGKELIKQNIPELRAMHGFWYSIAAGDFNNDGYTDFVAGNLGKNNRFSAGNEYPLNLYAIDIDMDGVIDPIMTAYYPDGNGAMTEYPVNYLDELKEQSPFFQMKFEDYTSFSKTGFRDMFKDEILKKMDRYSLVVNTTSSYIIWNRKGKFSWEELPAPAQTTPVTKILVDDFNGDKSPDLLLAGNDHTWDICFGEYDAGKGLILLNMTGTGNDKDRKFKALQASRSGILLNGMVGSLLLNRGTPSYIIAGINRKGLKVFESCR